jgi:hypothetical protein
MNSELVRVSFRSNEQDFDWQSVISTQSGYGFISSQKIENTENPNWPKWTIIIDYKRNKNGKN